MLVLKLALVFPGQPVSLRMRAFVASFLLSSRTGMQLVDRLEDLLPIVALHSRRRCAAPSNTWNQGEACVETVDLNGPHSEHHLTGLRVRCRAMERPESDLPEFVT